MRLKDKAAIVTGGGVYMKPEIRLKGADAYVVGQYRRFDQKDGMFKRVVWDESVKELGEWDTMLPDNDKPGFALQDIAFSHAGWYIAGGTTEDPPEAHKGLLAWENTRWYSGGLRPNAERVEVDDPGKITKAIKKVAKFYGASLVGISELDMRWVYSYSYNERTKEHLLIDVPTEFKYAIALAFEMDYAYYKYSPTHIAGAATGLAYSQMAFTAGLLSQFIRNMGYKALPMCNDTALSIPTAIDAGLGELGRNGILITPEFGPRVRLAKVLTDLPLISDKPMEFGVWDFCRKCEKCAIYCPGRAIMYGEPTEEINNISNNKGLLRWPVHAEKCLNFWRQNGAGCGTCIRVCPFNKSRAVLHTMIRWGVKNTPWLNPFFIKMDDLFGYGRRAEAVKFWD